MSNQTDILDNVLGIAEPEVMAVKDISPPKQVIVPKTTMDEQDIDNDYKYQRENLVCV